MGEVLYLSYSKPVRKGFLTRFGVGVVTELMNNGAVVVNGQGESLFIPDAHIGWDGFGKATGDLTVGESLMYGTIPGRVNGLQRATLRIPGNNCWDRPRINKEPKPNVAGFCIGDIVRGQVRRLWTDYCSVSLGLIRAKVWFHKVAKEELFARPWRRDQIVSIKIVSFDHNLQIALAEIPEDGPDPWFKAEGAGPRQKVAGLMKGAVLKGEFVIHSPYKGCKLFMVDVNGIRCSFNRPKKGQQLANLSHGWIRELHNLTATVKVHWVDTKSRRVFLDLLGVTVKKVDGDKTLATSLRSMILKEFGLPIEPQNDDGTYQPETSK